MVFIKAGRNEGSAVTMKGSPCRSGTLQRIVATSNAAVVPDLYTKIMTCRMTMEGSKHGAHSVEIGCGVSKIPRYKLDDGLQCFTGGHAVSLGAHV